MSEDTMTPEIPVENLVKVMPREDGSSSLNRIDALVAQGDPLVDAYKVANFKNLLNAEDKKYTYINDPGHAGDPNMAEHRRTYKIIQDEIDRRESEARNAGLLAPVDAFVHSEVQEEFTKLRRDIALGKRKAEDMEHFIRGLGTIDLRIVPNMIPVPDTNKDRLGGIQEYRLQKRVGKILGEADALLNKLKPANPSQTQQPQPPNQTQVLGGNTRIEKLLERQAVAAERAVELEEEQLRLARGGYRQFVFNEGNRLITMEPGAVVQGARLWLENRTPEQQLAISARAGVDYIASMKANPNIGMKNMNAWCEVSAKVAREGIQACWKSQPGYRQVMATFMHDLFELKDGHLIISGDVGKAQDQDTGGYSVLGRQGGLARYKQGVADSLRDYLEPNRTLLERQEGIKLEEISSAAVNAVDNLLFALVVYDSADEKRKVQDSNVYSEQPRTLCMPGVKGRQKWWKGEDTSEAPQGREEGWGGKLGEWLRIQSVRDPKFARKLKEGGPDGINFIPDRMLYGAFDHLIFEHKPKDYTIAKALCTTDRTPQVQALERQLQNPNLSQDRREDYERQLESMVGTLVEVAPGIYDYYGGVQAVDFTDLKAADLYGGWTDQRDSARKIYDHLTTKNPKEVFSEQSGNMDTLFDTLRKVLTDPMLRKNYKEIDVIAACYARAASPEGFNEHTKGVILPPDITEKSLHEYDHRVQKLMDDERIPRLLAKKGIDDPNNHPNEEVKIRRALYYMVTAQEPGPFKEQIDTPLVGRRTKAVYEASKDKSLRQSGWRK